MLDRLVNQGLGVDRFFFVQYGKLLLQQKTRNIFLSEGGYFYFFWLVRGILKVEQNGNHYLYIHTGGWNLLIVVYAVHEQEII